MANETEAIESQSTIKVTCAASGSFFTVKLYGGIGNGSSYYNGVSGKLNLTTYKGASRGMAFMCQASNEVSGVLVEHLSINVHCELRHCKDP